MLTVYGRRNSANVQKVMWLIAELGLPHEHVPLGGSFGGLNTPAFRGMNPHGKVPVISDGSHVIWESHSILRYLAAQYGSGSFFVADPAERARVEAWMDWSQTSLQPDFLGGVFWGFYRTPEPERNWQAIKSSLARCAEHFQLLEGCLAQHSFLVSDHLSLADIPIGALLFRYFTLDIERPALPRVEAWYRRLEDRPAYREHVMVPYDELRGRLSF